jgi:prepilin-type processing-associated H-X9-DG protein
VLASDAQSLAGAAAAIKGEQPGIADSATYKETIANLGDSNLLTAYVNLAPVQGVGYLIDGTGIGQLEPIYGAIAKGLENMQAMGVGVGFDGEAVSATMFLRAKPGIGPAIGPAAVSATAIGAAVLFPVFAWSRDAARQAACASDIRMLALAAQMYAGDNGGKLPTSAKWRSQLKPYLRSETGMKCPEGNAVYAFNKNLGGLNLDKIENPSGVVMFFEAEPDLPNASGSRANAILPHNGRGYFAYADGHASLEADVPNQSHWVPKYAAPKPIKKAPAKKSSARVRRHR